MIISRLFSKRPTVSGIVTGLLTFALLEGLTILAMAVIDIRYTWLWFEEYPYPLYLWCIVIPLISALLGLGIARKWKILFYVSCSLAVGIIIFLSYYVLRVL